MSDDYHHMAPWYDLFLDPFIRALRPAGFKLFEPDPGAEVLEIGCGTGAQLAFYRARGIRATGIDRSPAMLRVAQARVGARTLLCRGDAACLPFPDGAFALVLATLVLHEMDPGLRPSVMGDMVRVLAPEGRIGIVDYHPQPRHSLKGILARSLIRGIERAAGRRHFANYRHFIGSGGIPELAARKGLQIEHCKRVSGGNIGVYRLHRIPQGE